MVDIPLFRISQVEAMPRDSLFMRVVHAAAANVRDRIGNPCPNLPSGYTGPPPAFCPFLPRALKMDTVHFGAITSNNPLVAGLLMRDFPPQFVELEPKADLVNRAVLILLPNLPDLDLAILQEIRVQLAMHFYLPRGLMLGAFQLELADPTTGTRWTLSMFIVRNMVPEDQAFFLKPNDPEEIAIARATYARLFDGKP